MPSGKYETWTKYGIAWAKRALLRALIRPLTRWRPIDNPTEGYTIVAACHWRFPEMLIASLRLLAQQDLTHLSHLVIAFDAPRARRSKPRLAGWPPSFLTSDQASSTRALFRPGS